MSKKEKDIFLKAFRSRAFLRVHGFIADSENKKVRSRIEKYGVKNNIESSASELEKQRVI